MLPIPVPDYVHPEGETDCPFCAAGHIAKAWRVISTPSAYRSIYDLDYAKLERMYLALLYVDGLLPIPVHDYSDDPENRWRPNLCSLPRTARTGRLLVVDSLSYWMEMDSMDVGCRLNPALGILALKPRETDRPLNVRVEYPYAPALRMDKKTAPWGKKSRFSPGNPWKGKK